MTRILLSGCNGKMGQAITACVDDRDDCEIVAGVDITGEMRSRYPVFQNFADVTCEADVIIDFSHPSVLSGMLAYARAAGLPVVISTTGFSDTQVAEIKEAAKSLAIFFSFNMSLGINLLVELAKKAAAVLGDTFDIEIVEAHHSLKLDAPSGTAIMLADGIQESLSEPYAYTYNRHDRRERRPKKEIGMHSIRGGTIVGEHEVIFAGRDEIVTLSHSARSKSVFAAGAVNAGIFLAGKAPGLYNMKNLVESK